jgi:hypothetical protein
MKVFNCLIIFLVISLFIVAVPAAQIKSEYSGVGGTTTFTTDSHAQTGSNIIKFGDKNGSFNEITDSQFILTQGITSADISHTTSAIASNRVSSAADVKSMSIHSEFDSATLTTGSVTTTGCDAAAGSLGEQSSATQSTTGLSTSYPTTNYAIIKQGLTANGNQVQSLKADKAQVGDNIASSIEGVYNNGIMTSSVYSNTIKSFDTSLTKNYINDYSSSMKTSGYGDGADNITHMKFSESVMNMSNAFDTTTSSTNLSTADKIKGIIANNAGNETAVNATA